MTLGTRVSYWKRIEIPCSSQFSREKYLARRPMTGRDMAPPPSGTGPVDGGETDATEAREDSGTCGQPTARRPASPFCAWTLLASWVLGTGAWGLGRDRLQIPEDEGPPRAPPKGLDRTAAVACRTITHVDGQESALGQAKRSYAFARCHAPCCATACSTHPPGTNGRRWQGQASS